MEKIAILDCGGQYTKVIDRKIREAFIKSDIFPIGIDAGALVDYGGIVLTGGPFSIWDKNALKPDENIFSLGVPVLGICYGMHIIAQHFGGTVSGSVKKEYGEAEIKIDISCPLFYGLSPTETVLMSHGDTVDKLPHGFKAAAFSSGAAAALYNEEKNIYGVQFHPEVDMTVNGSAIFYNFLRGICGIKSKYSLTDRVETAVKNVKEQAGNKKVMALVSGGVDSAVTAGILFRALPAKNIYAIHIDHGLMRKNESDTICREIKNVIRINAKDIFFKNLEGIEEPEKKRAVIGDTFIKVLQSKMRELNLDTDNTFIAQGTLRPDLIESGNPDISDHAKKIKTHHNDVEIVRAARDKGLVIETNADWHKDEVRKIAEILGLPHEVAYRQPFPGPGLAVRVLCQDGKKTVSKEENAALKELAADAEINACMLPISSVGVQGDNRTYAGLAAIYKNESWEEMYAFARSVTGKLPFINRLVYTVGNADDIEQAQARKVYINDESVNLIREIDYIVTNSLSGKKISQTFAVLLPIGYKNKYSCAIRAFITSDFMTGRPAALGDIIGFDEIRALAYEIKKHFPMIDYVFYDITGKPPATCEWE